MASGDLPGHLRLHLHGFVSGAGTDLIQIKRHILAHNLCYEYEPPRRLRTFG